MEIETLRLFTEVAQRLSFAAVAEARDATPSTVSRAIAQLEDRLGARLLQRSTRRMALTEAGARFLARAQAIVEAYDEAREEVGAEAATPRGRLRLTASTAFGERMIAPLIPELRAQHPKIALELIFTDAALDLVAENIDLAIRLGPAVQGDLITAKLRDTRYRVVASPSYLAGAPPIRRPEDLAAHRCALFTLPTFRNTWRFRAPDGAETEVAVDGDVAISSALSLRTAVLQGAGPALLADWLIAEDLASGRLVDLFPDHAVAATEFETAAWLVYPSRAHLPRKVRAAIDFLRSRIGRAAE